ncbi:Rieske (2Fe-2S) protein [Plantactinospora sp. GCM10030261]|uniref:Rieske (2Fe-2S) protein n=1 Tax=Plantactinospora sp. GCM10030261 TaxID=3273420 RepID=UPI00361F3B0A
MSDDDQTTKPTFSRTRRALLAGAGAAGASVLLAACGTDSDDSAPTQPSAGTTDGGEPGDGETGGADGGGAALAKTSEIPVGGGKIFADQSVVVTQPAAGQFKAFSAICTHQNCPVARIENGSINCTCHGSRFSIADGSAQSGPATKPLPPRDVTVSGDSITLA